MMSYLEQMTADSLTHPDVLVPLTGRHPETPHELLDRILNREDPNQAEYLFLRFSQEIGNHFGIQTHEPLPPGDFPIVLSSRRALLLAQADHRGDRFFVGIDPLTWLRALFLQIERLTTSEQCHTVRRVLDDVTTNMKRLRRQTEKPREHCISILPTLDLYIYCVQDFVTGDTCFTAFLYVKPNEAVTSPTA